MKAQPRDTNLARNRGYLDRWFTKLWAVWPLAVLCVYIGFQPSVLMDTTAASIEQTLAVYPEAVRAAPATAHASEAEPVASGWGDAPLAVDGGEGAGGG